MSRVEMYRHLYEHEKYANALMLTMLESVPEPGRTDPRFQRAVNITGHLAACRENFLSFIASAGPQLSDWFPNDAALSGLRQRYAAVEAGWTEFLASIADDDLDKEFGIPGDDGELYMLKTEIQLMQLVGHAAYHRGQVVLLVDQLGGETVDTDYVDWALSQ